MRLRKAEKAAPRDGAPLLPSLACGEKNRIATDSCLKLVAEGAEMWYHTDRKGRSGMTIGERIRACRQRAGLSQERVAELVGVSRQAVTKWETNRSAPSTENLFRLAEIFGIGVDLLLTPPEAGPQPREELLRLWQTAEAQRRERRRRTLRARGRAALAAAAGYLAIYLAGRALWCSGSGSSLLGWLLSSRLYWAAAVISAAAVLLGKRSFSRATLAGFAAGLVLGTLLGPNPEGAAYGHGHYGWAIWGGVFLLSMPAGALLERRARQRRTAGAPAGENEKEAPPGPDGAQHLP